jgi:hypothetical protein
MTIKYCECLRAPSTSVCKIDTPATVHRSMNKAEMQDRKRLEKGPMKDQEESKGHQRKQIAKVFI